MFSHAMFSRMTGRGGRRGDPGTGPRHGDASRAGRDRAGPGGRACLKRSGSRRRPGRGATRERSPLAACALGLLLASCLNPPLEPQALTVTLTATPERATVGEEIRFRYESRGTNLSQTVVEYGTGDLETVPFIYTGGPPVNVNSQAGYFDYAYEEPGTYVARATVSTLPGDSRFSEVTVHIDGK